MKRLLFKVIEQKGSEKSPHTSGTLLETICVLFVPVSAHSVSLITLKSLLHINYIQRESTLLFFFYKLSMRTMMVQFYKAFKKIGFLSQFQQNIWSKVLNVFCNPSLLLMALVKESVFKLFFYSCPFPPFFVFCIPSHRLE